jgi:hypothetical protein
MSLKNGKTITDVSKLHVGDEISTHFETGKIDTKIIKIERNE